MAREQEPSNTDQIPADLAVSERYSLASRLRNRVLETVDWVKNNKLILAGCVFTVAPSAELGFIVSRALLTSSRMDLPQIAGVMLSWLGGFTSTAAISSELIDQSMDKLRPINRFWMSHRIVTGTGCLIGGGLVVSGDPNLYLPGLVASGVSTFLSMVELGSKQENLIKVKNQ